MHTLIFEDDSDGSVSLRCMQVIQTGSAVAFLDVLEYQSDAPVLANVATAPQHRRQGHAYALIESVIDRAMAEGKRLLSLWVSPENVAAVALYERLGFVLSYIDASGDGQHLYTVFLEP